jgi:nitroimidazol reductase NimA-like FMN-containing flavoprotein (pyridoxamine 5'-phosphate oxidase superfamily)
MTTHEPGDTEVLATNQCWELLRESVVGRLAVTVSGSPDIFPVNPIVDHGTILFRTSAGTKFAATKGKDVAFEVDGYDADTAQAWSVVVKGRAHEILEVEETLRALRLPLYPWEPAGSPGLSASSPRVSPVAVRRRRRVHGRRGRPEPVQPAGRQAHDRLTLVDQQPGFGAYQRLPPRRRVAVVWRSIA